MPFEEVKDLDERAPVDFADAKIHVLTQPSTTAPTLRGIRLRHLQTGPAIFRLDDHIRRLYDSCRIYRMEIPYTPDEFKKICVTSRPTISRTAISVPSSTRLPLPRRFPRCLPGRHRVAAWVWGK
jgi:branched-chain amino acid aminotransferase